MSKENADYVQRQLYEAKTLAAAGVGDRWSSRISNAAVSRTTPRALHVSYYLYGG